MTTRIIIFTIFVFEAYSSALSRVTVQEGILEGSVYVTEGGKICYSFLGVAFAAPPVGDLRFKAPQPPKPWHGTREAKKSAKMCKSYNSDPYAETDEDCLYLNIFTPNMNSTYPVMVFIHGGSFQKVSAGYTPDWLIPEDVILVTIAYRVGVFGFLSLNIEEAPGNAGLKDQAAALRWIKTNIGNFGGDPDNIMLFGQSAGATSINYHQISDMSKGLFNKVLLISGSALNPRSLVHNSTEYAIKLSKLLGSPSDNESEILKFLLTVDADRLLMTVGKPTHGGISDENRHLRELIFLPVIEKIFNGTEAFMTETVRDSINSGKFHDVPIMAGFTDAEGIFNVKDALEDPLLNGLTDVDFERYVPTEMGLKDGSNISLFVANQIRQYYYGNKSFTDCNFDSYILVKTDTAYIRGINNIIKLFAAHAHEPIYYYRFSFYDPELRKRSGLIDYEGAAHCDDLYYIFSNLNILPRETPSVERTRQRLIKMYTNFAKFGNPTPYRTSLLPVRWIPIAQDDLNYLSIDKEIYMSTNPEKERMEFWECLIQYSKKSFII